MELLKITILCVLFALRLIALYTMHFNFCRVHQTLRVTPAIEAGLTDHVWTIEEMLISIGR